jgi:DNA-binding FadR family transcriptional regulator
MSYYDPMYGGDRPRRRSPSTPPGDEWSDLWLLMRPERRRQNVVQALVADIVAGAYPAGASLPNEADLCARFEVSRTVVREAAKLLEAKGMISIQQGRGSIVLPERSWVPLDREIFDAQLALDDSHPMLGELMVIRMLLEGAMVEQAAERASPAALRELNQVLVAAGRVLDEPERFLELDIRFHGLLIEASGNRLATAIMAAIATALRASRRLTNRAPGAIASAHRSHQQILRHVQARDGSAARRAMEQHLEAARRLLAGGP